MKKFEAKIFKLNNPLMEKTLSIEATCFEEAVSRAYVWRVKQTGNTFDWRFKKISLLGE